MTRGKVALPRSLTSSSLRSRLSSHVSRHHLRLVRKTSIFQNPCLRQKGWNPERLWSWHATAASYRRPTALRKQNSLQGWRKSTIRSDDGGEGGDAVLQGGGGGAVGGARLARRVRPTGRRFHRNRPIERPRQARPYRNGQDVRWPSCGRDARHPDKRGSEVGQSVSSESGSRRNGTMPMKVMPLRSVQGFS